jgi:hypothetical protein
VNKKEWFLTTIVLTLILFSIPFGGIFGEEVVPAEQEALQQSLTIHEVEKELKRIAIEEEILHHDLDRIEEDLALQAVGMSETKAKAGKTARAYYMGDRVDLLILLFSAGTIADFLKTYDYLSYIFEQDQQSLVAYHQEIQLLKDLLADKEKKLENLRRLRAHLLAQKDLLAEAESKLSTAMENIPDKEKMGWLQTQLLNDWEKRGIPTFNLFLKFISDSMPGLANHFQQNISFGKDGIALKVTDSEFADYLQSQKDLFDQFKINFDSDGITFFGEYEGIAFTLNGNYDLISPEKVAFNIAEITYNGFVLPQSTAEELQKKYDLGIYPNKIMDGIGIKNITVRDGLLTIIFTLKL